MNTLYTFIHIAGQEGNYWRTGAGWQPCGGLVWFDDSLQAQTLIRGLINSVNHSRTQDSNSVSDLTFCNAHSVLTLLLFYSYLYCFLFVAFLIICLVVDFLMKLFVLLEFQYDDFRPWLGVNNFVLCVGIFGLGGLFVLILTTANACWQRITLLDKSTRVGEALMDLIVWHS